MLNLLTPLLYFEFSAVNRLTLVIFAVAVLVDSQVASTLRAQVAGVSTESSETTDGKTTEIKIQGVVVARKKYSFTVLQNGVQYEVRLADATPIALAMSKPWFDWENGQVVVDSKVLQQDVESKRVAVKLPSKDLHLVSQFSNTAAIDRFMSEKLKRVNFYVVTPEQVEPHLPTETEPFLAGRLRTDANAVLLDVGRDSLNVKLGFRVATIDGFSINALNPNETFVVVAGKQNQVKGEVEAMRVLFEPLTRAK